MTTTMNTGAASLSDEQRTTIQHAADKLRTVWANHTGDKESRELCHKLEALLAITPPVDSALKNHGVPLDVAWNEKNGKENWGHEPTAKGLFEDGWNAAMLFWGLSDSRDGGTGLSNTPQADAAPSPLPDMPANVSHVTRRIRRCENETAAQLVLEHFAKEYARAAIAARGAQEPVAWVRYRSDGGFEGPIMDTDARMCDTRRSFWTPLYAAPLPRVAATALTIQAVRTLLIRHAESYSEWDDGSIERIDFGQYGFGKFARALLAASNGEQEVQS